MASNHRIKFKLPDGTEFDAEGDRENVKADYEAFLAHLKTTTAPSTVKPAAPLKPENGGLPLNEGEPDDGLIRRIFNLGDDGLISLRVLPQGDNGLADGLLLLLYGYRRLAQNHNVFAVTLARAARQSGIRIERVDRIMQPLMGSYVRSGGARRSTTYTLNNQGVNQASRIAMTLLE